MAFTVQIPTAFACPNDDIFSLPTKEDLTNAINKIAQVPSKLRVAIVEMGEEIAEDVKKEIEDIIKTIEDFIETISEILSPYWKKGQIRNWQKEANDAITEFIPFLFLD
jgi:Asp-tRNA(Asn)/Glu-tRNA(Gln) amidotransferase C subunit